jgi:methylenetetrahydrofolate reductase (NADPH)
VERIGSQSPAGVAPDLVRAARIELIPLPGVEEEISRIPAGTAVTITCSSTFGLERTVDLAVQVALAGRRVVPHLAARLLGDEAELRALLDRLAAAGVRDLFAIGGDEPHPRGPYASALELLEALAQLGHGMATIGVAGYPEGHPQIAEEVLRDALMRKQRHADYMVSQLCFHPEALLAWLREMRAIGIDLPLQVGIAGPVEVRRLARLSLKIGVGKSLRYLSKQHGLIGNLVRGGSYTPDDLLGEVAGAADFAGLGVQGVHIFSFDQLDRTVAWQAEAGAGGGRGRCSTRWPWRRRSPTRC